MIHDKKPVKCMVVETIANANLLRNVMGKDWLVLGAGQEILLQRVCFSAVVFIPGWGIWLEAEKRLEYAAMLKGRLVPSCEKNVITL